MTENSAGMLFSCDRKAVVPHPRGADQIGVISERGQTDLNLFRGNQGAALANALADAVHKKVGTFHNTPAENDRFGCKHRDEICQAQSQIPRFSLGSLSGQVVTSACQLTNSLGGEIGKVWIVTRRHRLQPTHHCRTCGQRLPASMKSANTSRTRWVH